jgi:DNA processing protein
MKKEDCLLLLNFLFCDNPRWITGLVNLYSSIDECLAGLDAFLIHKGAAEKTKEEVRRRIQEFDLKKYKDRLKDLGIKAIFIHSAAYPALLKQISYPPPVLFCRGDISLLSKELLGMVGPREVTEYGKEVTRELASKLCGYFVIVSGMAKGVDAVAHKTVLDLGYPTVAVVGTGLDIVYPESNVDLCSRIISNGLLVSEYPLGSGPVSYHFPQRNRIISGISKGAVVCEAGERSGAMITARHAMEQNREVFAVPGSIFSPMSIGTHNLIQDGAKLVNSFEDVIDEFNCLIKLDRTRKVQAKSQVLNRDQVVASIKASQILTEDGKKIIEMLAKGPTPVDEIVSGSGISVNKVLQELMVFEISGVVGEMPGKCFQLK